MTWVVLFHYLMVRPAAFDDPWVRLLAAPGEPSRAVQFIDVRDVAAFVVRALEREASGAVNVTGLPGAVSMLDVIAGHIPFMVVDLQPALQRPLPGLAAQMLALPYNPNNVCEDAAPVSEAPRWPRS